MVMKASDSKKQQFAIKICLSNPKRLDAHNKEIKILKKFKKWHNES